jgi:hypothetical protein
MTDTPRPQDQEAPPPPEEPTAAEGKADPAPAAPPEAPEPPAAEAPPAEEPTAAEAPPAEPVAEEPPAAAAAPEGPAASETPPAEGRPPRPDRGAQERPRRRRRVTAAERHRRTFFAKLTELRKQEQAAVEANEPEPEPAAPAQEPATEAPAEEAPAAPAPSPPASVAPATSPSRSARAQARLVAAIERVGGAEAVLEALQPKRRDDGETMKWSSVCAEAAQGHKPGDPVFTAWVRLAATPVRDVKAIVNPRTRDDDRRGGRGGGRGRRSDRPGGGGGGYRGDSDRGRPARREELEAHGRDGSFRSSVRIVHVDSEGQRKDREDERRAEREAKRQAEAERLAKLGY